MAYENLFIAFLSVLGFGIFFSSLLTIYLKERLPINVFKGILTAILITPLVLTSILWYQLYEHGNLDIDLFGGLTFDWISATLLVITQFMFLITGLFSLYYIEEERLPLYTTLFFVLQLGMSLTFVISNFILLFVFWELMVLSGYVLVIFEKRPESFEAGFKYLIISSTGSLFLLMGIGLLTVFLDTLNFADIGMVDTLGLGVGRLAIAFIVIGFGVTGGLIGLNQWLPDAHPAAPAPISSLLSGIVVKAGIYGIYRSLTVLIPSIEINNSPAVVLIVLGVLTMTEGNIMVFAQFLREDIVDFKRILAYSTTVHLGYLLLVAGINTEIANLAMIFHIINHALAKGLLFMLSGYFIHEFGTRNIADLRQIGIGTNEKIISFTIFVSLFSLGGLPLTGGFVSKLLILLSMYNEVSIASGGIATLLLWALILAVVNSAMAFGGYLWLVKLLLFSHPEKEVEFKKTRLHTMIRLLLLGIAVIIIVLGIFPYLVLNPISSIL